MGTALGNYNNVLTTVYGGHLPELFFPNIEYYIIQILGLCLLFSN